MCSFCARDSLPDCHGCGGQHHHVGFDLHRAAAQQGVGTLDDEFAVALVDPGHPPAHVVDPILLDGAAHEFVVVLAGGTDVHVEHVGLSAVHLVLVEHRVLGRVHAADLRTVRTAFGRIARSGAGDKDDLLRDFSVRRAADFAHRGTGSRGQTLELQSGDHVLVLPVAVFGEAVRGGYVKSGGRPPRHRPPR